MADVINMDQQVIQWIHHYLGIIYKPTIYLGYFQFYSSKTNENCMNCVSLDFNNDHRTLQCVSMCTCMCACERAKIRASEWVSKRTCVRVFVRAFMAPVRRARLSRRHKHSLVPVSSHPSIPVVRGSTCGKLWTPPRGHSAVRFTRHHL